MSRRTRKTNKMRVRLDFTVEFDGPLDTLPMGRAADADLLLDYVARALMARNLSGLVGIAPGATTSFGLDYREPKKLNEGDADADP